MVIWLTGLSGSGKSTVNTILQKMLAKKKVKTIFLDGDSIREIYGNDLNFTIDNQTDGGTFNSVQDGQDNDIDFDIISMDNFIIDIDQIGNNNTLDIDVDGRTSDGSSMYFNQTGNNKSYSGSFWCGHTSCSMTINQN